MPIFLAMLLAQHPPAPDCRYDRAEMLALDERAFDQDVVGGWRALGNRGCGMEAADLIRDWRAANAARLRNPSLSYWHEGQLRAEAGQTAAAVALFDRSRKTAAEDRGFGWNHHVDGSIAFLRGDRPAFEAARARLAATPKPAGFDPRGRDGQPIAVAWPMNLNVLNGFARCWGLSYKVAYGPTCTAPIQRVSTSGK